MATRCAAWPIGLTLRLRRAAVVVARLSLCSLAVGLLLVGAARHYGWELAPDAMVGGVHAKGVLAKGLTGAATVFLLLVVAALVRTRMVAAVCAWWCFEELQVALCSFWFLVEPWPIRPGYPMCSEAVGFDLGALGIMIVAVLLFATTRKS